VIEKYLCNQKRLLFGTVIIRKVSLLPGLSFTHTPSFARGWNEPVLFCTASCTCDKVWVTLSPRSAEDTAILVLDDHCSLSRNTDATNIDRGNREVVFWPSALSTSKMQTLDVSLMGPFKTYYAQEPVQWIWRRWWYVAVVGCLMRLLYLIVDWLLKQCSIIYCDVHAVGNVACVDNRC
jgi:hypothetical protein